MIERKTLFIILLGIYCVCLPTYGQSNGQESERATTCEYLKNELDYALTDSRDDKTAYIYLIFRPGKKEKSSKYSLTRTKFILRYLKFRNEQFDRILITRRDAVSNLGSVEILVEGKRKDLVYFRKNTNAWNSCIE